MVVVAIEFDDLEQYETGLAIAKHHFSDINEDFQYCVLRERGKEALTCREAEIPYIIYQAKTHSIIDANINIETLSSDTRLFVRKSKRGFPDSLGFQYISGPNEDIRVERWPELMEDNDPFVGRKLKLVSHADFASMIKQKALTLPSFIKTLSKGIENATTLHQVIDEHSIGLSNTKSDKTGLFDYENHESQVDFLFEGKPYFNEWIGEMSKSHDQTHSLVGDFLISDVMHINEDGLSDNGKEEYRCYIINDKVVNMSRYVDFQQVKTPDAAKKFAKDFAKHYTGKIAETYVLDIANTDEGYKVVELNPTPNSGRYLNNLPLPMYQAVLREFGNGNNINIIPSLVSIPEPIVQSSHRLEMPEGLSFE